MALSVKLPSDCENVIHNFIRHKVEEAGADGVIIGLSGGLDSAVVAKLCCNALGNKKVTLLMMPENKNKDEHYQDAQEFADSLKVKSFIIEIENIIETVLNNVQSVEPNNLALGNLKARIRSNILYIHANSENLLVAGTSNKSELMIGYFTKYGDGGTDISPIGDLYKTQVKLLAEVLNIPDKIKSKVPTAGFIIGQTDENEIGMSYEKLDRILLGLELNLPEDTIAETVDVQKVEVERIQKQSYRNRHKRKFSKIPKLGIRTVGTDLRE